MFLAQDRVRNFRDLRGMAVEFDEGLSVLVGENNIGKTNLLDAIRAGLGAAAGQDSLRMAPDDRFIDAAGEITQDQIKIDLSFAALTEQKQCEFVELLRFDPRGPDASTVGIHFEWSYDDDAKRWLSRRWSGGRAASAASIPDDLRQALPVTRLDALRDAVGTLPSGRSNRLARALAARAVEQTKATREGLGGDE